MSHMNSKNTQQVSGSRSGGVPNLGNTIIQSPMLINHHHSHPHVSHSTENFDIDECKSISNSSKTPFVGDGGEPQPQFGGMEPEMETENNPSPLIPDGDGSNWNGPTSELKSLSLNVETGSMSDSEYWYRPSFTYTASNIPIETSTNSITCPNLLEALTTPYVPRRLRTGLIRAPSSENPNDSEAKPSDEESGFECEEGDDCSSGEIWVVNHEDHCQSKKRNRKSMGVDENEEELEGLNVIYVNGQKIDLNFLARVGDDAYEEELASMTSGMSRAKLVGFMESLEGELVGRGDRTRVVVDAEEFVNALPVNWKIELALRNRGGIASLYCRRYVSTSGIQFRSCKEAAIYLRDQSLSNVAKEEAPEEMRQVENSCHKVPKSVNEIGSSSVPEADVTLPAEGNLFDVEVVSLIDCASCRIAFEDIRGLEKHLASVHKETTRRFDLPATEGAGHRASKKHAAMDIDEPNLYKPHAEQNGEESSSSQKTAKTQESVSDSNRRFKTNCTWCNKGFLCEPVDAKTMADATGFMCPQCKDKICGGFERSLSRSHQP